MTTLLGYADEAIRLATADAREARRLASAAVVSDDLETRSAASRALGLAAIELGDADEAVAHLRRAVAFASEGGLTARCGEARMSLSWALTLQGTIAEALVEADRAVPLLEGAARARMQSQRALILQRLGRLDDALADYRRPLATFRRVGDLLWEARLLCNRGVLQVYRGALSAAEADFRRAEELHEANGQALAATQVRHNFGWVAARRGDVPLALEWYDRVEAEYRAHGVPLALLFMDRCEVLLSARLAVEARANALAAVAELSAAGMGSDLAEARLLAAHAELLCASVADARGHADQADHAFSRQHRPGWAALARAAAAQAAWLEAERELARAAGEAARGVGAAGANESGAGADVGGESATGAAGRSAGADGGGDADPRVVRLEGALSAARRAIRALEAVGWGVEALDARLIAGRAALELGRTRFAQAQLELAAAQRDRGPVQQRTRAWHAAALLRLSRADRRGASAAVAAGLRALEAHRMTLGATELRAHASGHGEELATLGLRLAVQSGDAARVLAAAERHKAAALLLRPARPPDDEALANDLSELRRVTAALDESLREGRHDTALAKRQTALENSVRRRALRARGSEPPQTARPSLDPVRPRARGSEPPQSARPALDPVGPRALRATETARASLDALGSRALVEFFALDGVLHAVTVLDGRARLHRLGAEEAIAKEVASLRFGLRSLASARVGSRSAEAMAGIVDTVAQRLDALLIAPLGLGEPAGRHAGEPGTSRFPQRSRLTRRTDPPIVLVPTGNLHALPWALLPSLTERAVAVAPSFTLWQRAMGESTVDGRRVLAAGPRLPAATAEIETLADRDPNALKLTGDDATVAQVLSALDGAGSAHLAAHGHFRDDNPLFCSLELADGHLTVYDLERLHRAPRRLTLSSCESGLSTVHAGDELMGFTAALFALGTATVIAAVVPVPDEATKGLMLRLDEELRADRAPAEALRNARADERAGAAFVCFGAG
jgi:CHAT domain-containing protein